MRVAKGNLRGLLGDQTLAQTASRVWRTELFVLGPQGQGSIQGVFRLHRLNTSLL